MTLKKQETHWSLTLCHAMKIRARNWTIERAPRVGLIWAAFGLVSAGYVNELQHSAQEGLLKKLQDFADPKLIGVLFLGAFVLLGLNGWIGTISSSYPDKLRAWGSGVADEVSDAATHFVAISLLILLWHTAIGSPPSWSSLLVPVYMLVPAIFLYPIEPGDLETKINESLEPQAAAPLSAPAINTGDEVASYGIAFSQPAEGTLVSEVMTIHGTATNAPPPEYELWLVRRWESHPYRFYPVAKIDLHRTSDKKTFEWHQEGCYVGAEPGKGQGRIFEIWRLGPESQRLFAVWSEWESQFLKLRNASNLPAKDWLSVPIKITMDDMEFVAKRRFVRQ